MSKKCRTVSADLGRSRGGVADLGGRTIVIVRHAQCEPQDAGTQGIDGLDLPLTSLGLEQAEAVGRAAAGLEPEVVLSSPMTRAVQTAAAIAQFSSAPLYCWHQLREVLPREVDVQRTHAELADFAGMSPTFDWVDRPGWQHGDPSYFAMRQRAGEVLRRLMAEFPSPSCVAVVTHGGFGNYLLAAALGLLKDPGAWFQLDHASVSMLRFPAHPEVERQGWEMFPPVAVEVSSLNDLAHLSRELRSCAGSEQ